MRKYENMRELNGKKYFYLQNRKVVHTEWKLWPNGAKYDISGDCQHQVKVSMRHRATCSAASCFSSLRSLIKNLLLTSSLKGASEQTQQVRTNLMDVKK